MVSLIQLSNLPTRPLSLSSDHHLKQVWSSSPVIVQTYMEPTTPDSDVPAPSSTTAASSPSPSPPSQPNTLTHIKASSQSTTLSGARVECCGSWWTRLLVLRLWEHGKPCMGRRGNGMRRTILEWGWLMMTTTTRGVSARSCLMSWRLSMRWTRSSSRSRSGRTTRAGRWRRGAQRADLASSISCSSALMPSRPNSDQSLNRPLCCRCSTKLLRTRFWLWSLK